MLKIHLIVAARPNFMKIAPLFHALGKTDWARPILVHTGQHYDQLMSDAIMRDLDLPAPEFALGVGSGTHAEQTGKVMIEYEKICFEHRADWIVVAGDVNSTVACAMVGAKLGIPVVHLEAGLRSNDRTMPEEINRIITDCIADVLWTPSIDGSENLLAEGVAASKIDLIGNIMIDSFEMFRPRIESSEKYAELGLTKGNYAMVTLHRPSNVDTRDSFAPIIHALKVVAEELSVVFVAHPRTAKSLELLGLVGELQSAPNIKVLEPLPYLDFMNLVSNSKLVITDSGGLQEETTYLGIPCLTLRENTERPITVTMGTNKLVDPSSLLHNLQRVLSGDWPSGETPPRWDGNTAERAVIELRRRAGV